MWNYFASVTPDEKQILKNPYVNQQHIILLNKYILNILFWQNRLQLNT